MKYKLKEKLGELHSKLEGVERKSLSIFARKQNAGMFTLKYIKNGKSKLISLGTRDEQIATRILTELRSEIVYGDTELGAIIQLNIAKLTREQRKRTWSDVHNAIQEEPNKKASTLANNVSHFNQDAFLSIKEHTLVETTHEQIMNVYKKTNNGNQKYMHQMYNYAKNHGWLVSPNLVPKSDWVDYEIHVGGNTAAIADEDHFKILALVHDDLDNWQRKINNAVSAGGEFPQHIKEIKREGKEGGGKGSSNKKRAYLRNFKRHGKDYYRLNSSKQEKIREFAIFIQLAWELGASSVDIRELQTDNLDWDTGHVIFKRKKWKGQGKNQVRVRMPIYFPMSENLKQILRPLYQVAKKLPKGKQFLLPNLAKLQSTNVCRIFHSYCDATGVKRVKKCRDGRERKLSVHSYRYRVAERLYEYGYTEREAKMLLGQNSSAVHYAYCKQAAIEIKAMDKMEAYIAKEKVIKIDPNKKVA